jgi:YD repeat-containing protein
MPQAKKTSRHFSPRKGDTMSYRFGTQFGRAGIVRAILLSASLAWALPPPAHAADIKYVYDENGRLVEVVAADGASAQYWYDAVGNISAIKKNTAATLSIAEFTPNSGAAGTPVTLYGSGFSAVAGSNTVKFNGVAALVSAATATSLTATVPAGATTGKISVANPNGSVTSAGDFVVGGRPVPAITAFTPVIGSAGAAFTISGANFQTVKADNKITFGNVLTPAITATPASLSLTVPSGAPSGKISVTAPHGKATSSADFYAVPNGINVADIEYVGRITVNGAMQTLTINGAGKKALLIFDGSSSQYLSLL